jgi:arginase
MIGAVEKAVAGALHESYFPVVLGGDCPVLMGALRATKKAQASTGLLFVDGHEDAYAASESPTGELADMELGFALGRNLQSVPAAHRYQTAPGWLLGCGYLGGQRHSLKGQVQIHAASELLGADLSRVTGAAIDSILASAKSFWLHIDLDVLSSKALPAVDYQQGGGLSWAQLTEICNTAVARDSVVGLDVTIYNPDLDPGQKKASRIVEFITEVVAHLKR